MKISSFLRIAFVTAALAFGTATVVRAQDPAVKARMAQRQGTIDTLKDAGKVGENNRGLLEPRGALAPDESKLVSDENADRTAVYAAIAAQAGTSADQVGRARAQKIAEASKPGIWIQGPDGSWKQK